MNWIRRKVQSLIFSDRAKNPECATDAWFEVYFVSGFEIIPAYLVIVTPERNKLSGVMVRECDDQRRVIYRGPNYEDVHYWLIEDEFSQVNGREFDYYWNTEVEDMRFEVWFEPGLDGTPRKLVVVTPECMQSNTIQILTPYEQPLFKADDYDEALNWLKQNSLHEVRGRHEGDLESRARN